MKSRSVLLLLLGLVAFAAVTPVTLADEADEAYEEEEDMPVAGDEEDEEDEDYMDEDDVDEHPLTDMPLPSPDVITSGVFPMEDMEKPRFAIGKPVETLVGVVNNGQEAINVTMIMGSINSPFDFNYFIQNFSEFNYNMIIQDEEEFSFHYRFQTASNLDPVDYQIALTVFYENDDELFSHTFFNESVTFYDDTDLVNLEGWSKMIGGLALAALTLFMFKEIAAGSSAEVASVKRASNGTFNDEWVTDAAGNDATATTTSNRKYANRRKKRSSGRKSR